MHLIACAMMCAAALGGLQEVNGLAPVWRVAAEARGVPAVAGSTVYFLSKRHEVIALDIRTGVVRWRTHTGELGDETYGTAVVPEAALVIAGDYNVVAFDAVTGARAWRFTPAEGHAPGLYLGAAADGMVFAGSPAGRLYAVNVADGSLAWMAAPFTAAKTTVLAPVVAGDLVLAGYSMFEGARGGGVIAVERTTGTLRWRREFVIDGRGSLFGGGLVDAGSAIVASSNAGTIYGLERTTGDVRWTLPPLERQAGKGDPAAGDLRPLSVSGHMLFAASLSGVVVAFDVPSRRERWRHRPDAGSAGVRIASDGDSVYVPHLSGILVALDAKTGAERWRIGDFTDGFMWAPAIASDRLYVGASRAGLFALPLGR